MPDLRHDGAPRLFLTAALSIVVVAAGLSLAGLVEPWDASNGAWQAMVSLTLVWRLQRSQDRDTAAIQMKLDEIVLAEPEARNELAGVEKED